MTYPVEVKDQKFTPDCLNHIPDAPVFVMRVGGYREWLEYRDQLVSLYPSFSTADFRAVLTRYLRDSLSPEQFEADNARLMAFYEAVDYADDNDQPLVFDRAEKSAVEAMIRKLEKANRNEITEMRRANQDYNTGQSMLAVQLICQGWSGLKTEFVARSVGETLLGEDLVFAAREELAHLCVSNSLFIDFAWMQLAREAIGNMSLTKDEEKNSDSLSRTSANQEASDLGADKTTAPEATASTASKEVLA